MLPKFPALNRWEKNPALSDVCKGVSVICPYVLSYPEKEHNHRVHV